MTSERVYTALLRLYPPTFRREYEAGMLDVFHALDADHKRSRVTLWRRLSADLLRSLIAAHTDACRATFDFAATWAVACVCGIVVSACLARGLAAMVGYFYHPYFEAWSIPPWLYGACLGLGLASAQRVVLRGRLQIGWSWLPATAASGALGFLLAAPIASSHLIAGGATLGLVVAMGQWGYLAARDTRGTRWAAAGGTSIAVAVWACATAVRVMVGGLDHVAMNRTVADPLATVAAPSLADVAITAASGLVVAALTARALLVRVVSQ